MVLLVVLLPELLPMLFGWYLFFKYTCSKLECVFVLRRLVVHHLTPWSNRFNRIAVSLVFRDL